MDRLKIVKAVQMILEAIGEDVDREGIRETPERVADMYAEVFSGLKQDPKEILCPVYDENHDEIVLVKDITFYSMCEHHLVPFFGKVHTAYIPKGKVVGISKFVRVVELFARRPQVQERMTSQIANLIMDQLKPKGVAVVVEAEHTCMTMRGVQKPGSRIVTSAMRGIFRDKEATRAELMALIQGQRGNGG